MDYRFAHFNFNVLDMEKSLAFYKEALELEPVEEKNAPDGAFRIVYLGDPEKSGFLLELTALRGTGPIQRLPGLGGCVQRLGLGKP